MAFFFIGLFVPGPWMAGRAEGKCGEFHPKTDGWEILCTVKKVTVFEGIRTRLHVTGVLTFGMHASRWPGGR